MDGFSFAAFGALFWLGSVSGGLRPRLCFVSPFQGLFFCGFLIPRALPWAVLFSPRWGCGIFLFLAIHLYWVAGTRRNWHLVLFLCLIRIALHIERISYNPFRVSYECGVLLSQGGASLTLG